MKRKPKDRVVFASNLPPDRNGSDDIPSVRDLRAYHLEMENAYHKSEVARLLIAIRKKDEMLQEVKDMLFLGLKQGYWPTVGYLDQLIRRLENIKAYTGPEGGSEVLGPYEELFGKVGDKWKGR